MLPDGKRRFFAVLLAFLKGVSRKTMCRKWFFAGEFVVKGVRIVGC
jgi:hypothetical protein